MIEGRAPEAAVHAFLQAADETLVLDVRDGCFWQVRWDTLPDLQVKLLGFEPS